MLGSLIVGVTEAVWRVEESVKVREALPFIIVPVVFIVAALYWPEVPLVERLTLIAVSGLILFVIGASIRSDLRKPRPPVTVDSGSAPKQYRIEWTSDRDTYNIKDSSGDFLAHALCSEPGASGFHRRFVFEGADGRRMGEMRITLLEKRVVFDGENRLVATFRASGFGSTYGYQMDDPRGRLLAESYGSGIGDDYQIVSPAASLIAHVHRGPFDDYSLYVDVFGNRLDPLLVYCYVVAIDNIRQYREFDNEHGGA
jgi:hypothetical protein